MGTVEDNCNDINFFEGINFGDEINNLLKKFNEILCNLIKYSKSKNNVENYNFPKNIENALLSDASLDIRQHFKNTESNKLISEVLIKIIPIIRIGENLEKEKIKNIISCINKKSLEN